MMMTATVMGDHRTGTQTRDGTNVSSTSTGDRNKQHQTTEKNDNNKRDASNISNNDVHCVLATPLSKPNSEVVEDHEQHSEQTIEDEEGEEDDSVQVFLLDQRIYEIVFVLDEEDKAAYVQACKKAPMLVATESAAWRFYRALATPPSQRDEHVDTALPSASVSSNTTLQVEKAAAALARYWQLRLEAFGPEKAFLALNRANNPRDETRNQENSWPVQIGQGFTIRSLPPDRDHCPVVLLQIDPHENHYNDATPLFKGKQLVPAMFRLLATIAANYPNKSLQHGIVLLVALQLHPPPSTSTLPTSKFEAHKQTRMDEDEEEDYDDYKQLMQQQQQYHFYQHQLVVAQHVALTCLELIKSVMPLTIKNCHVCCLDSTTNLHSNESDTTTARDAFFYTFVPYILPLCLVLGNSHHHNDKNDTYQHKEKALKTSKHTSVNHERSNGHGTPSRYCRTTNNHSVCQLHVRSAARDFRTRLEAFGLLPDYLPICLGGQLRLDEEEDKEAEMKSSVTDESDENRRCNESDENEKEECEAKDQVDDHKGISDVDKKNAVSDDGVDEDSKNNVIHATKGIGGDQMEKINVTNDHNNEQEKLNEDVDASHKKSTQVDDVKGHASEENDNRVNEIDGQNEIAAKESSSDKGKLRPGDDVLAPTGDNTTETKSEIQSNEKDDDLAPKGGHTTETKGGSKNIERDDASGLKGDRTTETGVGSQSKEGDAEGNNNSKDEEDNQNRIS